MKAHVINAHAMKMASLVLLLFISISVHADSAVWKISNGKSYVYIGGTIHMLSPQDYPLPTAYDLAYQASEKIILEADIDKMQHPSYQPTLMRAMVYTDGKNLQQVLDKPTFQRLTGYLKQQNIPVENILPLRPGWLSVTLATIELQKLGLTGVGVDQYFHQMAVQERKKIAYLESVEQQIDFISNMGIGQENELINHTLDEIEELPDFIKQTKQAWRKGDTAAMERLFNDPIRKKFPGVYQTINVDRNRDWQPQIEKLFKSPEIEFVLVGTLHLVGPDGLIAYFHNNGYRVEMLK